MRKDWRLEPILHFKPQTFEKKKKKLDKDGNPLQNIYNESIFFEIVLLHCRGAPGSLDIASNPKSHVMPKRCQPLSTIPAIAGK